MSQTNTAEPPVAASPTAAQALATAALGIAFWFAGAMLVRYGLPAGLLDGLPRMLTFALLIPVTWRAIDLVRRTVRPPPCGLLGAVLAVTATALLGDVVALTWFPGLYAPSPEGVLSGVVLIFWGVFLAIALAAWRSRASRA